VAGPPALDPGRLDDGVVEARVETFRSRLRRDPDDVEARFGLGVAYLALGLLEEAARELEVVAQLAPENPRVQTQLAVVLAEQATTGKRGAEREAWERVGQALRLAPGDPEATLLKARLLLGRGDWQGAVEELRPALAERRAELGARAASLFLRAAAPVAARGQWLDAARLWAEAVAADPEAAREPLLGILREHQATLLSRPRWSWLVYPPRWGFERAVRYAAATAFAALAAFVLFAILGSNDATFVVGLLPCLLTVVAPVVIFSWGRRRLRERAAPDADVVRAIRADPAVFFRGSPDARTILAAAEYVATELQGAAIVGANPWVAGRTSPGTRRAWRAASVRAPWLPHGEGDRR